MASQPLKSQLFHGSSKPQRVLPNEPELIQCLYEALQHQAGFHDFLAMLSRSVNGCAAQLSFIRRTPIALEHIWHAGLSDEFLGWYLDNNMIAHDAVTSHAITQQPGVFNSALPLLEQGPPGDDYERWESDQNMLDSAWLVVDASDTHIILLTIQRTVAQGPYLPEELEAMNRLVPFVRQTVSLAQTFHQHPSTEQSLSAIVELIPEAAFVLNNRGMVVLANQRGDQLLESERCLAIRSQRFCFQSDVTQKMFFRTITRASDAAIGGGVARPETLVINRDSGSPLVMSIRPLEYNELLTAGVLITVIGSDARVFPDAGAIAEFFALSPVEAEVCEDLVTGLSLKDIAEKRCKSESTIRSYLKQIFHKTGQTRQGQLISTILSALLR
ncbi:helix-turn-helix transcriptional regulator [Marinobacter sp. 1_MG-2023]|uniref:helix-turn-helix transcriptional regulator n=1 Tax=Marinobacter sp. 1_MG-2023 TaxID=3062627 RepID=UPI0026E20704|nr:helix-turn-helix transcriptional regulator [Marinobacter sp. 1_MG-2023]MDO6822586.1 helix-turn-helix transcriptional regulator [Marinobacter sp. 1_MG-2023]